MSKHSFMLAPDVKFSRNRFTLSHGHKTTMNVGDLVPVYVEEILPGDNIKVRGDFVSRLTSSFLKVPLDNLYLDLNFFFVPNRLIWDKFVVLMGENQQSYWTNIESVSVPTCSFASNLTTENYPQTLADYLGIPFSGFPSEFNNSFSQLPIRSFAKIWNDWYRNENTQAPVYIGTNSSSLNVFEWSPSNIFGKPPKVSKFHDLFTSALPQAQKGDAVDIPLFGTAPVITGSDSPYVSGRPALRMRFYSDGSLPSSTISAGVDGGGSLTSLGASASAGVEGLQPSNLYADLANVNAGTINDLRFAFALQRMFEKDAVYGTRYTESLQANFGIVNPDSRLQRAEYIGGIRTPIQFQQVAQTSQGTEDSPQANLSAFSQSSGSSIAHYAASEYGFILCLACIRQKHTYSQGIDKMWTRRVRTDFYNPVFAHIGEQPVHQTELFASADPNAIFGYQESWYEHRFHPDRVSGYMRPSVAGALDLWSFADNYSNAPVLNQSFLNETPEYVDRTLSVPSSSTPNFIIDFNFHIDAVRVLPLYGTPELIDHVTTR